LRGVNSQSWMPGLNPLQPPTLNDVPLPIQYVVTPI